VTDVGISHLRRCEELVSTYLSDNDPDAVLAVGADVRKIQYCFMLLKVNTLSLRGRLASRYVYDCTSLILRYVCSVAGRLWTAIEDRTFSLLLQCCLTVPYSYSGP